MKPAQTDHANVSERYTDHLMLNQCLKWHLVLNKKNKSLSDVINVIQSLCPGSTAHHNVSLFSSWAQMRGNKVHTRGKCSVAGGKGQQWKAGRIN